MGGARYELATPDSKFIGISLDLIFVKVNHRVQILADRVRYGVIH